MSTFEKKKLRKMWRMSTCEKTKQEEIFFVSTFLDWYIFPSQTRKNVSSARFQTRKNVATQQNQARKNVLPLIEYARKNVLYYIM